MLEKYCFIGTSLILLQFCRICMNSWMSCTFPRRNGICKNNPESVAQFSSESKESKAFVFLTTHLFMWTFTSIFFWQISLENKERKLTFCFNSRVFWSDGVISSRKIDNDFFLFLVPWEYPNVSKNNVL